MNNGFSTDRRKDSPTLAFESIYARIYICMLVARGGKEVDTGPEKKKKRDEKLGGNKSVRAYERQKGEDREREREERLAHRGTISGGK